MSKWDEIKRSNIHKFDSSISASFSSACFLPSNKTKFLNLLTSDKKNIFAYSDFYDLARFCEDFVLCETIKIPNATLEFIGPYFTEYLSDNDIPFRKAFHTNDLKFSEYFFTDIILNAEELHQLMLHWGDKEISFKRINYFISDLTKHSNQEPLNFYHFHKYYNKFGNFREYIDRKSTNPDYDKNDNQHISTILFSIFAVMTRQIDGNTFKKDELTPEYFDACMYLISKYSQRVGVFLSPGFLYREYFISEHGNIPLSKYLYKSYNSKLKEKINEIGQLNYASDIYIPPVLSILINRCNSRRDFIYHLCELRSEFEKLRNSLSDIQLALNSEDTLGERLKIYNQIEQYRDQLLKGLDQAGKRSFIRRTWDIVKSLKPEKILVNVADILLEIDERRQIISGLRHFSKLDQLTKDLKLIENKISDLFGDISSNQHEFNNE